MITNELTKIELILLSLALLCVIVFLGWMFDKRN
jgi:hypothetical protein